MFLFLGICKIISFPPWLWRVHMKVNGQSTTGFLVKMGTLHMNRYQTKGHPFVK